MALSDTAHALQAFESDAGSQDGAVGSRFNVDSGQISTTSPARTSRLLLQQHDHPHTRATPPRNVSHLAEAALNTTGGHLEKAGNVVAVVTMAVVISLSVLLGCIAAACIARVVPRQPFFDLLRGRIGRSHQSDGGEAATQAGSNISVVVGAPPGNAGGAGLAGDAKQRRRRSPPTQVDVIAAPVTAEAPVEKLEAQAAE